MLESIRKRKSSVISSFIIFAVVVVMAVYGFGGPPGGGADGGTAAWVNGEVITNQDFQRELELKVQQFQSVFGAQYDEKFLNELKIPQRTLDELIQFKLLSQQARRLNILVPDAELADYIRSIPYYQRDGKFDVDLYKSIPNIGLQEKRHRERLMWSKLQSYLSDRVHLTPEAVRTSYQLRETKVDLEYAKINFVKVAESKKPSAAELRRREQAVTEKETKAYYDNNQGEFTQKASARIRQIRVGIPYQASSEKKAEARAKIEAIAKKVTPENFAATAKTSSDDEYARKGGLVGWIEAGTLEPALDAAIQTLGPGAVSKPVETAFGYFLVLVEEKREKQVTPLDKVESKIRNTLALQGYQQDHARQLREKWQQRVAQGKRIDAELKKEGIKVQSTGKFSLGQGYLPNVGQSDNLMDAVFALSPKQRVADKLHYHQNHYYYLVLKSVDFPKDSEFEKSRDTIERSIETSLQSALLAQWVATLRKNSNVDTSIQFGSGETATGE